MRTFERFIVWLVATVVIIAGADTALAVPVELGIDFRNGAARGGDGAPTFSRNGISVDANGALLYRDDTFGYGIRSGEWDQIDQYAMLRVWFAAETFDDPGNWLSGVLLTDFFPATGGDGSGHSGRIILYADSGATIRRYLVHALDATMNGEYFLEFDSSFAPGMITSNAYMRPEHDYTGSQYSVTGFTTSVPEPGTLALLGVALLLMALQRQTARRDPLN